MLRLQNFNDDGKSEVFWLKFRSIIERTNQKNYLKDLTI